MIEIEKAFVKRSNLDPKKEIRTFGKALENIGINDFTFSDSETNFGKSSYLTIGPFKVRSSDHSVSSPSRILGELHLHSVTWNKHLEEIEKYYFPNRFEMKTNFVYNSEIIVPQDKLKNEIYEYIVIKEPSFITKKGRIMVSIRRKNIQEIEYKRIAFFAK